MKFKKNFGPFQNKSGAGDEDDNFYQDNLDIFTPFDFDDRSPAKKVLGIMKGMGGIAVGITLLIFLYAMLPGAFKLIFKIAEEFFKWVDKLF